MKKILAAIIILSAVTGISHADIVYTTSDGHLGVIPVTSKTEIGVPSLQYYGLGSDPLVGSFNIGTSSHVMVVNRNSDSDAPDTALIFSASDLALPVESTTLNGVYNTKTFGGSYNGRSVFFASRENASIVEFDAYSIDIPVNHYTYENTSDDAEYEPEFVDMSVGTYHIHALFRANPYKLEMLAFDGQLKEGVEDFRRGIIRNDATTVSSLSSNRFAIGAEEGVSIVNGAVIYTITSSDYPVKSICMDSGGGLYYVEQSEAGEVNIWHYDSGNERIVLVDSLEGYSRCQLIRDSYNNILAAMTGDSIYLYDMTNDEILASFDASSLGGIPLNITVSRAEYDEGSSSSSNCNLSGAGAVMISVLGFVLMKCKR